MMKSSFLSNIFICLLVITASSCSGTSGSKGVIAFDNTRTYSLNIEARKCYEEALRYSRQNKPKEAIEAFTRSIRIDPSAAAYNGRSVEFNRIGRYDRAIEDANRAIMMSPGYSLPYMNRGNAYFRLNDLDKAVRSYLRSIQLDPARAESYYNLGQAYYRKGLLDDARRSYDKTVELDPHSYAAWYNKACIASRKNDRTGAMAFLEKAVAEGFADPERMKQDQALENVRRLPAFQLLFRKMEQSGSRRQ